MRDVKLPEVRKAEILDASMKLFKEKGYLQTTTQNIINEVGISRGLLYYHFKNKEEILYILVEKSVKPLIGQMEIIVEDTTLTPMEKLNQFLQTTIIQEDTVTAEKVTLQETVQLEENRYMMDRFYHKFIEKLLPLFTQIIEEGKEQNIFQVDHPYETAHFLVTGYVFVSNDLKLKKSSLDEMKVYLQAFKEVLAKTLGIEESILD
ncbi:TetR/AcrR family transcriptional regulator [Oceanobacillus neutriphilus]|uniref:TetR family transcriptional regulator n=1 Tax=Oceanobacillus neutriphilus TaxID=531815 RepID=A0ABQ2NNZ2_9BACI|nr:TetR/AcrR family transcriptional regulator [Oceanobacillus neutriphilus]GGP08163.1 TetR family transcriptional regulator [Oceanobacillus neutriphilus]